MPKSHINIHICTLLADFEGVKHIMKHLRPVDGHLSSCCSRLVKRFSIKHFISDS